jgi:hypothetical protein
VVLLGPGEQQQLTEITTSGDLEGRLVLTNQRLLFETRINRGFLHSALRDPEYRVQFEAHLQTIIDVHTDKSLFGRPSLRIDLQGKTRTFHVRDPTGWMRWLIRSKAALGPYAPPGAGFPNAGAVPNAPVVVNVYSASQATQSRPLRCFACGNFSPPGTQLCPKCGRGL